MPFSTSRFVKNSIGPGVTPWISSPPIITATMGSPGMPSASMGMSAPPVVAELAASLAMTPSGAPLPNRSGSFEKSRASL